MNARSTAAVRWIVLPALAVTTGLIVGLALATAQQGGSLAGEDRKFVTEVAKGGTAEVELGKLAEQKASNEAVKDFGRRMATDHGKAGQELAQLAQQKGVTPPKQVDDKHRKLHDRLSKLSGPEFDRAYMEEMVKDHRKDVAEFKKYAQQGKDPDLKAWASKTLPTLEEHLRMAETVAAQTKGTAKSKS